MANARTHTIRGVLAALAVTVLPTLGGAQTAMPRMVATQALEDAAHEKSLMRFGEAYDLYRAVALSDQVRAHQDSAYTLRTDVFAEGIDCALRAGNVLGAAELIDTLIAENAASSAQWLTRIELALHQEQDALARALGAQGRAAFADAAWTSQVDALFTRSATLRETTTPAVLGRYRATSDKAEFGAVPFGEGVVFVSSGVAPGFAPMVDGWTGQRYAELRMVDVKDSADSPVVLADKLRRKDLLAAGRSKYHDGPVAFSPDERRAYVTRNQQSYVLDTLGRRHYHLRLDVLERVSDREWVVLPDVFPYNDSTYSVGHAALDTLGNLLFSSNRPGGLGGMDLWKCTLEADGTFGAPQNLGPAINSAGDDVFPFVNSVNQLYFATNGRFGFGGLDMHKHDFVSGTTQLLGSPVNTFADDFALHVNEVGQGYLSSNREGGIDRIYTLQLRDVFSDFEVEFVACDDLVAAGMNVEVHNLTTQERETLTTSADGKVSFRTVIGETVEMTFDGDETYQAFGTRTFMSPVEGTTKHRIDMEYTPGDNEVQVAFEDRDAVNDEVVITFVNTQGKPTKLKTNTEGYLRWGLQEYASFDSIRVDNIGYQTHVNKLRNQERCPRPESFEITMTRVVEIDLDLILYDLNKATLRPEAKTVLDEVITYMTEVKDLTLELSSHTDCRGSNAYNQELSQRRAQSCVDYIIAAGITKDRILAVGHGETLLVNQCADGVPCTEAEHQMNRRTELRIVTE
jgi:outer membrane protein OmpA-like peptidoglycan-associated protein